jgi:agmatinase
MDDDGNCFLCANKDFRRSKVCIAGIPYDGTSSNRCGARFAPKAIREASHGIESYSVYQKKSLQDKSVSDMGDIPLPLGDAEFATGIIKSFISPIVREKKCFFFGGEHLISLPIVDVLSNEYKNLFVVQFDAHADLRDSWMGEKLSHASVMRRVAEIIGFERLLQLGIRSGTEEEFKLPQRKQLLCEDFSYVDEFIKIIGKNPVYLSIDLDVLDTSVAPGVGTPEPGGRSFIELIETLMKFSSLNVVGCDLVELSPHYDSSGNSSIVAASIAKEVILNLF